MNDEDVATGVGDASDEIADEAILVAVPRPIRCLTVTGTPTASRIARTQCRDQRGLGHQARAEASRLHALRRTAAIEVDLVVAPALAEPSRMGELRGVAAAELQRDRMLGRIEFEMPRHVAVRERGRGDHLRVEPRAFRDHAHEIAAVPIGPVHHRRDAEAPIASVGFFNHIKSVSTRIICVCANKVHTKCTRDVRQGT